MRALAKPVREQLVEVETYITKLVHERDTLSRQTAHAYPGMAAQDVLAVRTAMANLQRRLALARSRRNRLLLKLGMPEQ